MADRLPQYPMLPNFSPIPQQQAQHQQQQHLQQSQQQQQQAQQQHQAQQHLQQLQQQHNNATNQQLQDQYGGMQQNQPPMDQNRAWQMLHLQQNRQNGGEMNPTTQQQMAEMMKRQMQGHAQVGQRPPGMLQNQQGSQQQGFMPSMGGGPIMGSNSQQLPFHDSTPNHSQPGHMAPGFSNIGGGPAGNVNQGPSVPRTPQQQPNMLLQRQLELMNAAQNQQNQNGPVKISNAQIMQQQQQMNQQLRERELQQQQQQQQQQQHPFQPPPGMGPNPGDIFPQGMSNEAMRRPSPHPGAIQQGPNSQGGPSQPNTIKLPPHLADQRSKIIQAEQRLAQMAQELRALRPPLNPKDQAKMQMFKDTSDNLKRQREAFQKSVFMWQAQAQRAAGMAPSNGAASGLAPGLQPPGWNNPQQPPFAPEMQATRSQAGSLPGQPPMPSTTPMQASASLPQTLGQGMVPPGLVPPRTGATPQQPPTMGGQPTGNIGAPPHANFSGALHNGANAQNPPFPFPGNGSQGGGAPGGVPGPAQLQPGAPRGGPNVPSITNISPAAIKNIPPLEKARFDTMHKTFLQRSNIPIQPMLIDNRPVDPYRLHIEVMKEGGWVHIESKDYWTVIGARLGYMQFPGSDTEPARSGPVVGQQLQNFYKAQLASFDSLYIAQAIRNQQAQQLQLQQQRGLQHQVDPGSLFNLNVAQLSPQHLEELVRMSNVSVPDLKAQGVDEKTIAYVEHNRANLQRHLQEHRLFQAQLKQKGAMGGQPEQGAMPGAPPGATRPMGMNAPPFPQQNAGPAGMLQHQQMLQRQAIQQQHMHQLGLQSSRGPLGHPGPHVGPLSQQSMALNPGMPKPVDGTKSHEQISLLKREFMQEASSKPSVDVPIENRMEYNQLLESLNRQIPDTEMKIVAALTIAGQAPQPLEPAKRLLFVLGNIQAQRQALSMTSTPRFFLDLPTLKILANDFNRNMELLQSITTSLRRGAMNHAMNGPNIQALAQHKLHQMQLHAQQQQNANRMVPQPPNIPNIMQQQQPSLQQQMHQAPHQQQLQQPSQPQLPSQYQHIQQQMQPPINGSLRQPPASLHLPASKRKAGATSTPSPAPVQASTPATSAPTPTATASSPPAGVKSPKAKATPKVKNTTVKRRPSTAKNAPNLPAAPTPEVAQTSNGTVGAKRPREDDTEASTPGASGLAGEPSPPKRAKTEWESSPSAEVLKQEEVAENLKTEEDASDFLDHFSEILKQQAAGGEAPDSSLTSGLSETLDMLLKGYPTGGGDMAGSLLVSDMGGSGLKEASPPPESFDQFFDFSDFSVGGEQEDFKAPTPDLSSSASSTNPSPESNHEADAAHLAFSSSTSFPEIKSEDAASMLRVAPWKDMDAGEGIFFQPQPWSWDTPMPSLDPPWAISNS